MQIPRRGLLILGCLLAGIMALQYVYAWSASQPAPPASASRLTTGPKERADALTLIAQLQQAGGMTRYSCEAREAFVTPTGWQATNADTKQAMMVMFLAACNSDSMSIMDSQSGKRLARVGPLGYAVD